MTSAKQSLCRRLSHTLSLFLSLESISLSRRAPARNALKIIRGNKTILMVTRKQSRILILLLPPLDFASPRNSSMELVDLREKIENSMGERLQKSVASLSIAQSSAIEGKQFVATI